MNKVKVPMKNDHYGYSYLSYIGNGYHPGLDLNYGSPQEDEGMEVYSLSYGVVVYRREAPWYEKAGTNGWGNLLVIKTTVYNGHELKTVWCRYAHLQKMFVNVGDKVDVGTIIGLCGHTGTKYAHLHFDIMNFDPNGRFTQYVQGCSKEWVKKHYLDPRIVFNWYTEKPKQVVSPWAKKAWDEFIKNKIIRDGRPLDDTNVKEIFIILNRLGVLDNDKEPYSRERLVTALYRLKNGKIH